MSLIVTEIDKLFVEKKTKPGPIGQIPIYNEVILCTKRTMFLRAPNLYPTVLKKDRFSYNFLNIL